MINKRCKGITLIALIITIIMLLILAGVTINVLIGDNGLFNTAKTAGEEYIKSGLKEELEAEIVNIQSEKIANGEAISKEDLMELSKIGAVVDTTKTPIIGQYKNHNFVIDENHIVTIGDKLESPKAKVEVTTEEITFYQKKAIIKIVANLENGIITNILALNDAVMLKENISDTEKIYEVNENGQYQFQIIGSNGGMAIINVNIEGLWNGKEEVPEGALIGKWKLKAYTVPNSLPATVLLSEEFDKLTSDYETTYDDFNSVDVYELIEEDRFRYKATAYFYSEKDFTLNTSISFDDDGVCYLNNKLVKEHSGDITLNFNKGWNKIDAFVYDGIGRNYFCFSVKLSENENITKMISI